jgi:hypothetical protein
MCCGDVDVAGSSPPVFETIAIIEAHDKIEIKTVHLSLRNPLIWRSNQISFIGRWSSRQHWTQLWLISLKYPKKIEIIELDENINHTPMEL